MASYAHSRRIVQFALIFCLAMFVSSANAKTLQHDCDHQANELAGILHTEIEMPKAARDLFRERLFAMLPPPFPKREWSGLLVRVFISSPAISVVVTQKGRCIPGQMFIPASLIKLMLSPKLPPPEALRPEGI